MSSISILTYQINTVIFILTGRHCGRDPSIIFTLNATACGMASTVAPIHIMDRIILNGVDLFHLSYINKIYFIQVKSAIFEYLTNLPLSFVLMHGSTEDKVLPCTYRPQWQSRWISKRLHLHSKIKVAKNYHEVKFDVWILFSNIPIDLAINVGYLKEWTKRAHEIRKIPSL